MTSPEVGTVTPANVCPDLETPTSDLGSNGDLTPSDVSTPTLPPEPFEPRFKVKVTDAVKNGDVLTYTVKTTEIVSEKECAVSREYEDFEFLHHCLVTSATSNGIILPPLPPKPVVDPKDAHVRSKKVLGNRSKILIGDEFHKDCKGLERYLRLLVNHRMLGISIYLDKFLTEKQAPERVNVKKGFFGKLSTILSEARKAHHRDVDEYFQTERDWSNQHSSVLKEVAEVRKLFLAFAISYSFTHTEKCMASSLFVITSNTMWLSEGLAGAFAHLSTALLLGGGVEEENLIRANKLLVKFSEALEDAKHGCDVDVFNDENTLGFHLDWSYRHAESLKEMLFHRTCLMVDYEEANRVLDKAKAHKHTEVARSNESVSKVAWPREVAYIDFLWGQIFGFRYFSITDYSWLLPAPRSICPDGISGGTVPVHLFRHAVSVR
ncbi:hypothetical protein LSH36_188g06003 [Paralvinella palmiformis]|uniref:PX domain-containing protein n=1 Tax=Paralvinella palmiformis TaxID=53620 RepID=A0AAD9JS51_9ANNE|nr:hypothetical protein LSH36_188g06003 [Paralvinella palmiformis]